jgi:hypothetical protein
MSYVPAMSLYMLIEPRDPDLLRLVEAAVLEGRPLAIAAKRSGKYMSKYWDWPTLSWMDSGFPSIHVDHMTGPTDYNAAFSLKESTLAGGPLIFQDIASFQELIAFARNHEALRARLLPPTAKDRPDDPQFESLLELGVIGMATAIIDRTIHLFGDRDVSPTDFRQIYLELEAPYFDDKLAIEILVPIALTKFEAEGRMQLADNVFLERMDDPTHLARYPRSLWWSPAHGLVISAATHALVLSRYEMPVINKWQRDFGHLDLYPVDIVDRFFAALRLVAGFDTGYAQIVLRPVGWAEHYMETLPPLIPGPSVHRYPNRFDNYGWLVKDRRVVSEEELAETASIFSELLAAPAPISLASRRLNSAMLRDDETDSVVDLCTGLEALLTDETRTEMTHKLALRAAAITSLSGDFQYPPPQVFKAVKRIYEYRSRLVHGRADAEIYRTIQDLEPPNNEVPTVATELLRRVLRTLLQHPAYLETSKVDAELIVAALGKASEE